MSNKLIEPISHARYGELSVFKNDSGAVTQSLLCYGEWAQNEITFLKQFIVPGSTVLDVGAYVGTHSLAFVSFAGSSGRVIAFEAQPETFALLECNLSDKAVQLHNAAVSNRSEEVEIPLVDTVEKSSFGSASLAESMISHHREGTKAALSDRMATVPAITIDSLDLDRCDLIKIDVEGMEDLVLEGSLQTLKRCLPVIYCECNAISAGLKSIAVLHSAGYEVMAHVVDAFNPDNFRGESQNIFANAREVAILGFPRERAPEFAGMRARPVELLLPVGDADDLALALLNKPQYQTEVLEVSEAARAGGNKFLGELRANKLEVRRLHEEASRLQLAGEKELNVLAQLELALRRKQDEVTSLNGYLKRRDAAIRALQGELTERNRELEQARSQFDTQVHAKQTEISAINVHLEQRDAAIRVLQKQMTDSRYQMEVRLDAKQTEISATNTHLVQRDAAIERLQQRLTSLRSQLEDRLEEKQAEISATNAHLVQRDAAIRALQQELATRNQELAEVHSHLKLRDESIVRLQEQMKESGRLAATLNTR